MPAKRYIVTLTKEEKATLSEIINKLRHESSWKEDYRTKPFEMT
jgi:hypothetical protein